MQLIRTSVRKGFVILHEERDNKVNGNDLRGVRKSN